MIYMYLRNGVHFSSVKKRQYRQPSVYVATKNFRSVNPFMKVSIQADHLMLQMLTPSKLALLAKTHPQKALALLNDWGECNKTIEAVYNETIEALVCGDQTN